MVDRIRRSHAEQHAQVEAEADLFYDDFVERVAEGRNMSVVDVEAVARGRVWTGADALQHGLVDELGGLRAAVARAKMLAGLEVDEDVRVVELSRVVVDGLSAPAVVIAAGRRFVAGRGGHVAGPFGGRRRRAGRAVGERRQRAVARRTPF